MKVVRVLALVGAGVLGWRYAVRRWSSRVSEHGFGPRFSFEQHPSAASAAGSSWRDDRDVSPIAGPLDHEELRPMTDPKTSRDSESAAARKADADRAYDSTRQPGVPPETATDYDDIVDIEGAESFPASDPPSGW